jgi:ribosomal protein S2
MLYLNNEGLFLKFYSLGYASILPSYIFVSNIETTGSSIFEAIILDIPNSCLLDSNQGFYGIFYGLQSNDDSFVSINMFTKIFIKIFLKSEYDSKKIFNEQKKKKIIQKYKNFFINFYASTPYSIKLKKKRRFLNYISKDI